MSVLNVNGYNNQYPVPIGTVFLYAGDVAKIANDYLVCNGQQVNAGDYDGLFQTIGVTYNATAPAPPPPGFFCVPDLTDRFIKGSATPAQLVTQTTTPTVILDALVATDIPTINTLAFAASYNGTLANTGQSKSSVQKVIVSSGSQVINSSPAQTADDVADANSAIPVFNYSNGGTVVPITATGVTPMTNFVVSSFSMVYIIKALPSSFL